MPQITNSKTIQTCKPKLAWYDLVQQKLEAYALSKEIYGRETRVIIPTKSLL